MCVNCESRVRKRLATIIREYKPESEREYKEFCRDEGIARRALVASPQPGIETRAKAARDRVAEKEETMREKLALRAETMRRVQNLHDYHGWSWKALAEKYDPNFSKDPEAATLRMRIAARECVSPSVRKLGQLSRARLKQERPQAQIWRRARGLHVEQNLTWREIAQRLDPDFAKDPEAAIARIMMGSRRVSPVRDLAEICEKRL
jgi:hypothetical protein